MTRLTFLFAGIVLFFSCTKQTPDFSKLYHVPQITGITIDGDISEWENRGLQIPLFTDRFGNADTASLFVNARLAWDKQNLYLMAEVFDDVLHQDSTGPIWRNDGLEVFLSANKGTSNFVQYLIAPALTEAIASARFEKRDFTTGESSFNTPGLQVASKVTLSGYQLEIAIPFSVLDLKPQAGDTLAFNFYINDSDGDRSHQKFSWHYNENTYLNHDAFHEIVLAPRGKNYNVLTRAWLVDTTDYHIALFSEKAFDGTVRLIHNDIVLKESAFEQQKHWFSSAVSFPNNTMTDKTKPLEIWFDDTRITQLQWIDMERKYVNMPPPNRFEREIFLFEKADLENFPPKGATLFVGSSSIRLWRTIQEDLPGTTYINRGFGGSSTSDVLHFFDRIVAPYHPSSIVFFTGTNDIASGVTPQVVADNTEEFIIRARNLFPDVRIFILSNTIAVSRKHLYAKYHQANNLIEQMLENYDNAVLVDVTTPGLITHSVPRPEIYTSDSLHLNREGYRMWGNVLRPYLSADR